MAVTDVSRDAAAGVAEIDGLALELDVRSAESVAAAVTEAGRVDVLVNNAGIEGEGGFFANTPPEQWDPVLEIDLRGVMLVTHAVIAGMQERGYGRIVNVASEAGRLGSQVSSAYSAAKAGVIGFTKTVARESSRYGVTCNAVAPGPIRTPMFERLGEGDTSAPASRGAWWPPRPWAGPASPRRSRPRSSSSPPTTLRS